MTDINTHTLSTASIMMFNISIIFFLTLCLSKFYGCKFFVENKMIKVM